MLLEIFLVLFIFVIYFLFYVEYKINKHNKIYEYDKELTRQNINNEILLKMPFYFDGSHLNSSVNISNYKIREKDKTNKFKEYNMVESELILLKPYIKSSLTDTLYSMKKDGQLKIHTNDESINYYFVRDGSAEMILIHPKFKDNFENAEKANTKEIKDYIENNDHFHKVNCSKGTITFVPNGWMVYVKNISTSDCLIEKLTYSTIINKFMLYFKKKT
jgi:hypothetical protein